MAGLADPNAAVELSLNRATRLIQSGAGNTLSLLQAADRELLDRLQHIARKHGGPAGTYTEAHAQIYRQQIRLVTNYVQQRMLGKTNEQAREAIKLGVKQTVALATRLEEHWTGITRPLALHSQAMQDEIVRGTGASRIRQNEASWQRYGDAMTRDFERQLRLGQLMGLSHHEVISRVISAGAKGGLDAAKLHEQTPGSFPAPTGYVARRYWAERIVRTETAYSYNAAGLNTMQGFRNTDFPDMQKKILAHFDNRTAPDSIAVHGQIRPLDGYFMDGAGRQYLHPPGRPNDRETVIPWRPHWGELEATEPPSVAEQIEAQQEATSDKLPAHAVAQRRATAAGAIQAATVARKLAQKPVKVQAQELLATEQAQPTEAEIAKQEAKMAKQAEKAAKVAALKAEKQVAKEVAKAAKAAQKKLLLVAKIAQELVKKAELLAAKKAAKAPLASRDAGASLPSVLPTAPDGTPLRPVPVLRRRKLPTKMTAAEIVAAGQEVRRTSRPRSVKWHPPNVRKEDAAYQQRMYFAPGNLIDANGRNGLSRFSYDHDFLIRKYMAGATKAELEALEAAHAGKTVADQDVRGKVERSIRSAHEIERVFARGEDSPAKTVFRGLGGISDSLLTRMLGGDVFDLGGMPSSSSISTATAESFMKTNMIHKDGAGVMLELHRKSKAIGFDSVSQCKGEDEVLLHGNTQWRVLRRQRMMDWRGRETWHIEAEEISP